MNEPPQHEAPASDRDPAMGWELIQFDWGTRDPGPPTLRRWRAAARRAIAMIGRTARRIRSMVAWGIGVICPRSAPSER
jgi:hypothetical protein